MRQRSSTPGGGVFLPAKGSISEDALQADRSAIDRRQPAAAIQQKTGGDGWLSNLARYEGEGRAALATRIPSDQSPGTIVQFREVRSG